MNTTRRNLLGKTLFGAGGVGLRALATGVPISVFTQTRRALADDALVCAADAQKLQYLILSTSSAGDPVNANVPGTYEDKYKDIVHAADPSMAKTAIKLGNNTVNGAQIWSTLPQTVLDRTCFFHHGTYTNNHPNLPKVMRMMGGTAKTEMLPSIMAKALAPCMNTVQSEPVSCGAGDILTYNGRGLPNVPPTALSDILSHPQGPITNLHTLRDQTMDKINAFLKSSGTAAQKAYIDSLALSRTEARSIADDLLSMLSSIKSDRDDGQVIAAAVLCKMKVAPVVAISINFGGDNHADAGLLVHEVPGHQTGVQRIADLQTALGSYGLQDKVTFAMYNVFGRTLIKQGDQGRGHWASHHVTVMIGKNVKAGVIGGVEPQAGDYYSTSIDSASGAAVPGDGGDIKFTDTLTSMGKTLGAALGVNRDVLDANITLGKVVPAAIV